MPRLILSVLAAASTAVVAPSASAAPRDLEVHDPDCRVVRILPSGRKVVRPAARVPARSHRSAASAVSGASASASGSSVSVASSSSGRGSATASSTSNGRTVTTTHDDGGCTIVIDDRGRRGGRQ